MVGWYCAKRCLDGTEPESVFSGGKRSQRQLWEPGEWEKKSSRIVFVRSNTGETPGSRPLQRQEDALMVPNPRASSRGGSAPRDSSGSLTSGERFPPE